MGQFFPVSATFSSHRQRHRGGSQPSLLFNSLYSWSASALKHDHNGGLKCHWAKSRSLVSAEAPPRPGTPVLGSPGLWVSLHQLTSCTHRPVALPGEPELVAECLAWAWTFPEWLSSNLEMHVGIFSYPLPFHFLPNFISFLPLEILWAGYKMG